MGLGRRVAGVFFVLLILTYEFHSAILVLASTNGQTNSYEMAGSTGDFKFFRRQLENGVPPDGPLLEQGYIVPNGVNLSLVDEIWLKIAPLISLGYNEKEIIEAIDEAGLQRDD